MMLPMIMNRLPSPVIYLKSITHYSLSIELYHVRYFVVVFAATVDIVYIASCQPQSEYFCILHYYSNDLRSAVLPEALTATRNPFESP